jgi:hypothetical protein
MENEKKAIVKRDFAFIQKVGNQIAITNKLLQDDFDYLKWWHELDKSFRRLLLGYFELEIRLDEIVSKYVPREENEIVSIFKDEIDNATTSENENENYLLSEKAIKYITKFKRISLHNSIVNLESLRIFTDLEKLKFSDYTFKNLEPLNSLKKLKVLDCSKAVINPDEIVKFKMSHPDCEVIEK